ncbi:Multicopper oxidase mco [Legionella steigerwaltii]|uniref:Multicopper oxidase mco n=1 Tax=Legionella steigerwaltii TaxID=460 RepID=A0A378L7I6_9GAMM|nr:multicopper oxidase domain-containing protein [Legionella steigerwaltii]KTD77461.1 Multicopper oxidase mco [Legionella steigerwaltii]STY22684.1 Multicopper oxidase mco [Legionella steigerwaltii]
MRFLLLSNLGAVKKITLCSSVLLAMQYSLTSYASYSGKPPLTFKSVNHQLNIAMVANQPATTLTLFSPNYNNVVPWTWDICDMADFNLNTYTCNTPASADNQYGGPLLQLQKGDTLNITLVNNLPLINPNIYPIANLQGIPNLNLNPTNIHTHGLIVSPHYPIPGDPQYDNWGDNIFLILTNSANGPYNTGSGHDHGTVIVNPTNSVEYSIYVPEDHPSGLYWIHPHLHGLTSAQISMGMRGMITIGQVSDYVSIPGLTNTQVDNSTSYLALQDSQLLPGTPTYINTNPDPTFCPATPNASEGNTPNRQGFCPGQNSSAIEGGNYIGGSWYHSVSGLVYPQVNVTNQEILAIANVSDSTSYNIELQDRTNKCNMLMQILAVDGISIDTTDAQALMLAVGGKFVPEPCPESNITNPAVCTSSILMMPSARVEVLATYRDCTSAGGNVITQVPGIGAGAVLTTTSHNTGIIGDYWPQVDLVQVQFAGLGIGNPAQVKPIPYNSALLASEIRPENPNVVPQACQPLAPGNKRRIFYGNPQAYPNQFGLAYEVIDQNGNVVGPPATDLVPFSLHNPYICLPLGPNNTPATEVWELVNVATEDHNFHIHQQKFQILTETDIITGEVVPSSSAYLMDNVPIPHAIGNCGQSDGSNPISDWRTKRCKSRPMTIQLNFSAAGDYVYHCHILQHEDGGMMQKIKVIPFPSTGLK